MNRNSFRRSPKKTKLISNSVKVSEKDRKSRFSARKRSANPLVSLLFVGLKLAILGIGIGAIAGTVLTFVDPSAIIPFQKKPTQSQPTPESQPSPPKKSESLSLKQELTPLKQKLAKITAKYPKLQAGAFFVDLDNGAYVNFHGETVYAAASTIKIPILVAFFEDVDAGKIQLDEPLTMTKDVIAGGSGEMQYQSVNKKFTALETATQMIVISDNTATNMLIKRLGGKEVLNQRFKNWGMQHTVILNLLPDLEGTNTTSPKDLVMLLAKINQGELISLRSRDRLLGIMRETKTKTLLPQGLEKGAIIAHKTGDIGTIIGDAGIIDMHTGKRYLGAVIVKRPNNDITGRNIIQEISRTTYQHFKWYLPRSSVQKQETEVKKPE